MTKQSFLYYDNVAGEWKPATLEELAILDDPELTVCPLEADGSLGQQIAYAELERSHASHPVQKTPPPPQPPAKQAPAQAPNKEPLPTEQLLRFALRYICSIGTFFIFALCLLLGAASGTQDGLFWGFFFGAIVSCACYYRAKSAAKSDKM